VSVRTRTLTNLLLDIRWQADQLGATLRNDDTSLTRALNQSIQAFREWISDNGFAYYLRPSSGTCPIGATAPYAFGQVNISAISPAVVRVYGFDLTIDNVIYSLDAVAFAERNNFQGFLSDTNKSGIPISFSMYDNNQIALLPPAQAAYPYTLWYLPVSADLAAGSDTFDGIAGWEEWLIWDVLMKLVVRESDGAKAQLSAGERERVQAAILKRSRHLQRQGPMIKRDTRSEKMDKRRFLRSNWRV
jgi:hypothetical protein